MRLNVFVDTSAWCALACSGEAKHAVAKNYYQQVSRQQTTFVTSDYILSETLTLLRLRFGYVWAEQFWNLLHEAIQVGDVLLLRVDESIWQEALQIFFQYQDQRFSFTDCTSFALMRREGIETAFTFDHHFWVMGFVVEPGGR